MSPPAQAASERRRGGADEAMAAAVGGDGSGQHACDAVRVTVQREFAQRLKPQRIGWDRADGAMMPSAIGRS